MKSDFNFFVPVDEGILLKASKKTSKTGRYDNMVISGVASDSTVDTDQEVLEPSGFELGRFLKYGWINYDHRAKDNPKFIIGEPIEAKVNGDKFFVKAKLFKDRELARDLFDTMILLKETNSKKKVGFSIEGKALERDPQNPKRITKALITGLAATMSPKNANSYAEICKGEYNDSYVDYEYDLPNIEKSEANGGKVTYLVDITNHETGVRYTIDKNLNLKVEKAISTTSAMPLVKESLEGKKIKKLPLVGKELESIVKANEAGLIKEEFLIEVKDKLLN